MTTDERTLLGQSIERFAAREIAPQLEHMDHAQDLPESILDGLGTLGLFELDTSNGGLALLGGALETLSLTAAAPAALVLAHAVARQLLVECTTNNGQSEIRARALSGPVLCAYPLYAEPGFADEDVECRDAGGDIVIDGRFQLVVGAPVAEVLVLPVSEREVVVLDRNTPGLEIGRQLLTLGMRGCPIADVSARGLRVSRARRLTAPIDESARRFRGPAAAIAAGLLERSLRTATSYALQRYQGGSTIIAHQQVRAMLATMIADASQCRSAAARLADSSLPEHEAMGLFIDVKERAARGTVEGVQLLGGYGYMEDYGQERCMRDARQAQCLLGRTDVQRQQLMKDWLAAGGADA